MSSLTRRMQIRDLKRRGYCRTPFIIVKDIDGSERPQRVTKGGLILSPSGEFIGRTWPRRISAAVG